MVSQGRATISPSDSQVRQAGRQAGRQASGQASGQAGRQAEGRKGGQAGRKGETSERVSMEAKCGTAAQPRRRLISLALARTHVHRPK